MDRFSEPGVLLYHHSKRTCRTLSSVQTVRRTMRRHSWTLPRATTNNLNAVSEICVFDYGGDTRHRALCEHYFRTARRPVSTNSIQPIRLNVGQKTRSFPIHAQTLMTCDAKFPTTNACRPFHQPPRSLPSTGRRWRSRMLMQPLTPGSICDTQVIRAGWPPLKDSCTDDEIFHSNPSLGMRRPQQLFRCLTAFCSPPSLCG